MKKQTAVDWLSKQLWETPQYGTEWQKIIDQAKEMHKQEIIDAVDGFPLENRNMSGVDYYEKTYGGNNEQQ